MSERSYCPSAKRDVLSNKLQTINGEPCDSLRRGLCRGLSFCSRSRLSDHIKNLQRLPDTPGGMKSSRTPQTCLSNRTPVTAVRGFSIYRDCFRNDANQNEFSELFPTNGLR